MPGVVFGASIAAFVLIILFFNWYYKKMTSLIFGKMNDKLDCILARGEAPGHWKKQSDRLNRVLAGGGSQTQKDRALARYAGFVENEMKDLLAYAGRTPHIEEDGREAAMEALRRFRDDTLETLRR